MAEKRTLPGLILLIFLLLPMTGCSALHTGGPPIYPIPPGSVSVDADRILHEGKPFAELRYFRNRDIVGLAIYYYEPGKEVWIFPEAGWTLVSDQKEYVWVSDIDRVWNDYVKRNQEGMRGTGKPPEDQPTRRIGGKYPSKSQIRLTRVSDVKISEDGRLVYYQTPGKSYDMVFAYEVETGRSRMVERIDH